MMKYFKELFSPFKKDFVYIALELGAKNIIDGFTNKDLVEELKKNSIELISNSNVSKKTNEKKSQKNTVKINAKELDKRLEYLVGNYFEEKDGVYTINAEGYFRNVQYQEFKTAATRSKDTIIIALVSLLISLSAVFITVFKTTTSKIDKNQFEILMTGIDSIKNATIRSNTKVLNLKNEIIKSNTAHESVDIKIENLKIELESIHEKLNKLNSLPTNNN